MRLKRQKPLKNREFPAKNDPSQLEPEGVGEFRHMNVYEQTVSGRYQSLGFLTLTDRKPSGSRTGGSHC